MAIAPPDGVALSWRSFGRATSASWSSAVSKKPPAGSAKCSRIASASPRARHEPALVEGRLVQGEQARRRGRRSPRARRPPSRGRPSTSGASRPSGVAQPAEDRVGRARPRPRYRARVGSSPSRAPRRRPRSAAIASPFQAASTLSSRAGCGRAARREQRRARRREPLRDAPASRSRTARQLGVAADPRQDRRALPVAVVGHAVRGREQAAAVVAERPRGPPPRTT